VLRRTISERADSPLPDPLTPATGSAVRGEASLVHAVDLLRTLPRDARREGLSHGDLNPGNILRDDSGGHRPEGCDRRSGLGPVASDLSRATGLVPLLA